MNPIFEILWLVLIYVGLAGMTINTVMQERLFRQMRRMAEKYPPYPVFSESGDAKDTSSVQIEKDWDEESPGRD